MENGRQLVASKRVRLGKVMSREILRHWDENGRVDGGHTPNI